MTFKFSISQFPIIFNIPSNNSSSFQTLQESSKILKHLLHQGLQPNETIIMQQ